LETTNVAKERERERTGGPSEWLWIAKRESRQLSFFEHMSSGTREREREQLSLDLLLVQKAAAHEACLQSLGCVGHCNDKRTYVILEDTKKLEAKETEEEREREKVER
jgi:hypothetical protein